MITYSEKIEITLTNVNLSLEKRRGLASIINSSTWTELGIDEDDTESVNAVTKLVDILRAENNISIYLNVSNDMSNTSKYITAPLDSDEGPL